MFLKLGYYCTESSGHASEYNQWFRKRPDLIEKYCTHSTNWNPGEYAYSLKLREKRSREPNKQYDEFLSKPINLEKSYEYAADIFNAKFGDGKPFIFNGNVLNRGSIPNLPFDACVEVPVVVDRMGMRTTLVGNLPEHLAILVNTTARIENLAIEAAMKKSREMVYYAVYNDPLTSAVCSLDEIKRMCDELFEVQKDYLGDFK
jgi:alpha-galactosidase